MSFFQTYIPRLLNALQFAPDGQPSPLDEIQGSLAGVASAAGNPNALLALNEERQNRRALADSQLRQMLQRSELQNQNLQQQRAQQDISSFQTPQQKQQMELDTAGKLADIQHQYQKPDLIPLTDRSGQTTYYQQGWDPSSKSFQITPATSTQEQTVSSPDNPQIPYDPNKIVKQLAQVPLTSTAKQTTGTDFERYYQDLLRNGTPDTPQNRLSAFSTWQKNEPSFQAAQTNKQTAHEQQLNNESDRSYQYHASRLDNLRKPVEQQLDRLSRLSDTLAQGTPQADALIAPELLTAMAGGQGSGLRMNEAEISRIVGGRTNWETLKAKLGAWETDPSKGFALTPEQRQQVQSLLSARTTRLQQQQQILDDAGDQLVGARTPQEHRAIYNTTQKKLSGAMGPSGKADPLKIR